MNQDQPITDQLTIAITGSHGLVGSHLIKHLEARGHCIKRIVRSAPKDDSQIRWSPTANEIEADKLMDVDVVINLAGEPVVGRWNAKKKQRIRDSRVMGTRLIAQTLAALPQRPKLLINASGIGYFGSRGDEVLTEAASLGQGFLADVCKQWEAATEPAIAAGVRVAMMRFGMILSPKGGALAAMLPAFKLGIAGRLSTGKQWMSWITLDDVIAAIEYVITHHDVQGPVNTVSPTPVTNQQFTQTLARVLHRPAILPVPAFALRLIFGELADEALLASGRAIPDKLTHAGFTFADPNLEPALRRLLQPET